MEISNFLVIYSKLLTVTIFSENLLVRLAHGREPARDAGDSVLGGAGPAAGGQ